jgi:hypothetical protein
MLTKPCSRCARSLSLEAFNYKNAATGRRQSICRVCLVEKRKEDYARRDRAKALIRARRNRPNHVARNKAHVANFLAAAACARCDAREDLGFYAGGPGQGNQPVHMAVCAGNSLKAVEDAVSNSDVLCKPCRADLFMSSLGFWQLVSSDERKAIQARRKEQGFVKRPKGDYKRYLPVAITVKKQSASVQPA